MHACLFMCLVFVQGENCFSGVIDGPIEPIASLGTTGIIGDMNSMIQVSDDTTNSRAKHIRVTYKVFIYPQPYTTLDRPWGAGKAFLLL